jgi:hypothetical protein
MQLVNVYLACHIGLLEVREHRNRTSQPDEPVIGVMEVSPQRTWASIRQCDHNIGDIIGVADRGRLAL